jgi:hypothetical protein
LWKEVLSLATEKAFWVLYTLPRTHNSHGASYAIKPISVTPVLFTMAGHASFFSDSFTEAYYVGYDARKDL